MFLDATILILQEILEASLLLSLLLALTSVLHRLWPEDIHISMGWAFTALGWGIAGACLYSWIMPVTSGWFDHAGYEMINVLMQTTIIVCLVILSVVARPPHNLLGGARPGSDLARFCMIVVVASGIVREGSEIILYLQGVMGQPNNIMPAMLGALMASGIGSSSGFILYYALTSLPTIWAFRIVMLLLALFTGNMAAQSVVFLTQADWLPYTPELWNSSAFLPENSITGRVLYVLIGYEANPSLLQAGVYLATAAFIMLSPLFRLAWCRSWC